MRITLIAILLSSIFIGCLSLIPKGEPLLYPNTQNSPSLFLLSFQLSNSLPTASYLLVTFDWYSSTVTPFDCQLVNTSISVRCTNLANPLFALTISSATMISYNSQLATTKTVVVQLGGTLSQNTNYSLQIYLYNVVPNIKKISPSIQFYAVSSSGLVYEQNLNFGPTINQPPFNNLLTTSILNDLSTNQVGDLSMSRAQFQILVPITTPLSSFIFVVPLPFYFTSGTIVRAYASQLYASNPIDLYKAPSVLSYQVTSKNIFTVVFNQTFISGRKFILEVTEIQNPFFLARSNISIYSMNYGSLTPSEGFQQLYPIQTVTSPLTINFGLPYDIPIQGPCQIFRSKNQYGKINFNMPMSVPAGYAIKLILSQGSIYAGTVYVNFQSLIYTPVYYYASIQPAWMTISKMGPIASGTNVAITFKFSKDAVSTLSISVQIDTQAVISLGTATSYMFSGVVTTTVVDQQTFYYNFYDSIMGQSERVSSVTANPASSYIVVTYQPAVVTSANSFMDMYLPPLVKLDSTFNANTDCNINGTANSAICVVTQTPNYLYISVQPTANYSLVTPIAFPISWRTDVRIYKVLFPTTSSLKNIYPVYLRLYRTNGVSPVTYITSTVIAVVPPQVNRGLTINQYSHVTNQGVNYLAFARFESATPATMNYVLQQNEVRVVSTFSLYSYNGLSINNLDAYPCTSNINVNCIYQMGNSFNNQLTEWYRVHIFFTDPVENSTKFHVVIPDQITNGGVTNSWAFMAGIYNKFTKDYKYIQRFITAAASKATGNLVSSPVNIQANMYIDMQGKAGSYRSNVIVNINHATAGNLNLGPLYSAIVITTKWSFYEKGISSLSSTTLGMSNPTFGTTNMQPVSVYVGSYMYLTVIPYKYTSAITTFSITLNNVHMPYTYDLPDYRIYVVDSSSFEMKGYNQFLMTNAGVFYESPLSSLTVSCLDNSLGVVNTMCTVVFGTQNPLKANGTIKITFSGMTVATSTCYFNLTNGSSTPVTCASTQDNLILTVTLLGGIEHYAAGTFTLQFYGIGIDSNSISQSLTLSLMDSTATYSIQSGTRIITTTVMTVRTIQIQQISYLYTSPLSANMMSIKFYLPRSLYNDETLGFIMGKDLSDVNTEIKRLNIGLYDISNNRIGSLYKLISAEYKVLFSFYNPAQIVEGNYTIRIYGLMTPASQQNGPFQIIYQRNFDNTYSLINTVNAQFPSFSDRIISTISILAYFNTQGYSQQISINITNQDVNVDDQVVWIINFPSYYSDQLFNSYPYCLIQGTPIQCVVQPNTPFQLMISNSPKIIQAGTQYTLTILNIDCPRKTYTMDIFPNRYIFVGVLAQSSASKYSETALIYPQQSIQQSVAGIITLLDIPVSSTTQPAFSSIYATLKIKTNIAISSPSYLYITFPSGFDNFNNRPLDSIITISGSNPISVNCGVKGNRVQVYFNNSLPANSIFTIAFPSLPTPRLQVTVKMSQTQILFTPIDRRSILAASMISSNSAPTLTFKKNPLYISLNYDNVITVTAGTYSSYIDIASSDGNPFLTNINLNLSSTGFIFEPSTVYLKLGDRKGTFRIGVDSSIFPIDYFYTTVKQDQGITYYTITTNNNIRVTNSPVTINIPSSITLSQNGCSLPYTITLPNPPYSDIKITFNYNNTQYNQSIFFPNPSTTKSQLQFNPNVTTNMLSFCSSDAAPVSSFTMQLVISGLNFMSYQLSPSPNITINIVSPSIISSPTISLQLLNQQPTFVDIRLATNVQGNIYYYLYLAQSPLTYTPTDLQLHIINHQSTIQSMGDYMTRLYTNERDLRVGLWIQGAGNITKRLSNLIVQKDYTLCVYLQNTNKVASTQTCLNFTTSFWGRVTKIYVSYTKSLSDVEMNNVLCFFTKSVSTQLIYLVDIEGNSCYNSKVQNLYYKYKGSTSSYKNLLNNLYLITNPNLVTDPSFNALQSMFSSNQLSSASLATAISGFSINYLSANYISSVDARSMTYRNNTNALSVSFNKPIFYPNNNTILVPSITLTNSGSVYFLLVLYKQIVKDSNSTYVNIRLNIAPTAQQMMNCQNWQGITAQGCARAVYVSSAVNVTFTNVANNSMYILYYGVATEYPTRPVFDLNIKNDLVVTFVWGLRCVALVCLVILIII